MVQPIKPTTLIQIAVAGSFLNIVTIVQSAIQNKPLEATLFTFMLYISLQTLRSGIRKYKAQKNAYVQPEFDSKDIYLTKNGEIIGLHAIGHAGPYEYDLVKLDGTTERKKDDFMQVEVWGNEYDKNHNMLGRGSFRVHQNIEEEAKGFEADGWVRCEAPKKVES